MSPRRPAVVPESSTLREHLIGAAQRIVARGAGGVTVREIAREAQVADGVLYNHFADKEELLALGLHAHVRAVTGALPEPPVAGRATVESNLRDWFEYGFELHARILPAFLSLGHNPRVLQSFSQLPNPVNAGGGLRELVVEYLRAEQRLSRVDPDAPIDSAATMLVGTCHELVLPRWFAGDSPAPTMPAGQSAAFAHLLAAGVASSGAG